LKRERPRPRQSKWLEIARKYKPVISGCGRETHRTGAMVLTPTTSPGRLLPSFMLEPRVRKMKKPTLAAARALAEEFDASLTATLFKMTILNRFPMIIVCHNKTRRRWYEAATMIQPWWRPVRQLSAGRSTAATR
jgi:hypothetical protein